MHSICSHGGWAFSMDEALAWNCGRCKLSRRLLTHSEGFQSGLYPATGSARDDSFAVATKSIVDVGLLMPEASIKLRAFLEAVVMSARIPRGFKHVPATRIVWLHNYFKKHIPSHNTINPGEDGSKLTCLIMTSMYGNSRNIKNLLMKPTPCYYSSNRKPIA